MLSHTCVILLSVTIFGVVISDYDPRFTTDPLPQFPPVPELPSYPQENSNRLKIESSSAVNKDGSFKFISNGNDIYISVEGSLKKVNGTKTLTLHGSYVSRDINIAFVADEHGFNASYFTPDRMSNKVLASILG